MQGKLIVFEGVEGSGKTTQLRYLQDWLQTTEVENILGVEVGGVPPIMVTREPGGTELGFKLRQLLLEPQFADPIAPEAELLLYAADRAQHVEGCLKPHLHQGYLVVCDRYTDSTVAYQGYGRGLSLPLIDQLNQIATGGLTSDVTLWLDVAAEVGLARTQKRGKADRMEAADLAFHQRVEQGFNALYAQYPERIVRIDANQPPMAIAQHIQAVLTPLLTQWFPTPLRPLLGKLKP
ncbi:MAG: dTMP kinase [Leptolyngbyaceae bacterium]|nr:dTMP kinase [Leptolyngbyaceae bacterium]